MSSRAAKKRKQNQKTPETLEEILRKAFSGDEWVDPPIPKGRAERIYAEIKPGPDDE